MIVSLKIIFQHNKGITICGLQSEWFIFMVPLFHSAFLSKNFLAHFVWNYTCEDPEWLCQNYPKEDILTIMLSYLGNCKHRHPPAKFQDFSIGYNYLIIWDWLYFIHKYLLSPWSFYGRNKIPTWLNLANRIWENVTQVISKRKTQNAHGCFVLFSFTFDLSTKKESSSCGNYSFSLGHRTTDKRHQPNPKWQSREEFHSQSTESFVGINCVLWVTGMLQSIATEHWYSKYKLIQK